MSTTGEKVGFIGAGNMATALVKGIISSDLYTPEMIKVSDVDTDKIKNIYQDYSVEGMHSNRDLVKSCNIIILSVKPQVINDVLEDIKDEISNDHIVISIAAGIKIAAIQSSLGKEVPVIRVMPNTPALVQKGVSAVSAGKSVSDDQIAVALDIFNSVGTAFSVQEEMMDAVTALSGSGPGFIFRIMECFVEAAEIQGFDSDTALEMITRTFLGSAILAEKSGHSLSNLRKMVTSPGGTTEAGLKYLESNKIEKIINGTIKIAKKRSVELGKKE
ncbi:pyrroline-5-carboxylate reductase [Thermodesulfobacteriota bacterium]